MVAASTGEGRKAKGERRLGAGERGGVGGGQSKEGSDRKGERAVVLWRGAWSGGVWWQSTVVCVCGLCVKCGVWLWGVGCQDCRCLVSRETRCARIRIGKIRGSNLKLDQVRRSSDLRPVPFDAAVVQKSSILSPRHDFKIGWSARLLCAEIAIRVFSRSE